MLVLNLSFCSHLFLFLCFEALLFLTTECSEEESIFATTVLLLESYDPQLWGKYVFFISRSS